MTCSTVPQSLVLLLSYLYGTSAADASVALISSDEWCGRYLDCPSCIAYSRPSHARTATLRETGADEESIQRILREERCGWDASRRKCINIEYGFEANSVATGIRYVSTMKDCPAPTRSSDKQSSDEEPPPDILPNWMGTLINATQGNSTEVRLFGLANLTLSDISLPGTHDTLSYDLSLEISDDGLERSDKLDGLLHAFSGGTIQLLPGELEDFLRDQSKTQRLNITGQLNGGIRFLDVRIMMEEEGKSWYGVHFMQTRRPVMDYLIQIRQWLDDHPQEIVVMWLSKHGVPGATGEDQYPGASIEDKQRFWSEYCRLFDGLLIDTAVSQFNSTPIGDLIERSHRVVIFATDYVQFTNSSKYAIGGSNIDNWVRGEGAFDEEITLDLQRRYFQEAPILNRWAKANGKFTLMGMNTEGTEDQILGAAKDRFLNRSFLQEQLLKLSRSLLAHLSQFLGVFGEIGALIASIFMSNYLNNCPAGVNIPGVTKWCPSTLLEIAQLSSYYDQMAIEETFLASFISPDDYYSDSPKAALPNAFYLDGLDTDGTIRTGVGLAYTIPNGGDDDTEHEYSRYAYVDTVVAYNAELACRSATRTISDDGNKCKDLRKLVAQRRQSFPMQRWDDLEHGRRTDWPH